MFTEEKPLDNLVTDGGFCAIFRNIGCIGDSLASGEHESHKDGERGYHDYFEHSWGQYIARACGSTVHNFSCGGLTAAGFLKHAAPGGWERFNVHDPDKKCEAYIIALGVNDVIRMERGEGVFGSIDDVHPDCPEQNADSFAGNMGKIISMIKEIQPKARVFLMTMPRGIYDYPLDEDHPRNRHQRLMYELAEKFEFTYVIDLRKYGPVYDGDFRKKFYLGGHMNSMGYLLTAKYVMSYIDYIIRYNTEDFTQVGFIGRPDDLHNDLAKW